MRIVVPYTQEVLDATVYEYQEAFWPLQFIFVLSAFWLLYAIWNNKGKNNRIVSATLAFYWFWTGSTYAANYYNDINWAGFYICLIFVLQGLLLLWVGIIRKDLAFKQSRLVPPLATILIVVYPLLQLLGGSTLFEISIVGMLPDSTALFSLLILLFAVQKREWRVLAVPVIWLIFSGYWHFLLLLT